MELAFITSVLQHSTWRALIVFDFHGQVLAQNDLARELWIPAVRKTLQPLLDQAKAQLAEFPTRTIEFVHASPIGDLQCQMLAVDDRPVQGFTLSLLLVGKDGAIAEPPDRIRARYALENAEDGLWDWDAETGRVFRSERCLSMFGYAPDSISEIVDSWSALVHPDDQELQKQAIVDHLAGGHASYKVEYRICDAHGRWRWVLDRGKVIQWSPDRRPLRVVGTHTDITDYKELEARLRERDLLLEEAQRIGHIGSWAWDPTTDTTWWSDELYRIAGWPMDRVPADWSQQRSLYTADSFDRLEKAAKAALEQGTSYLLELELLRPDGEKRIVEAAGEVVFDEGGRPVQLIGVMRDLTEERRATETARWRNKLLNRIAAMGRIGGFDLDLETGQFQWTDENYRIHGIEPGFPITLNSLMGFYDADSQARLREALERMLSGAVTEETLELEYISPDERRMFLRVTASLEEHDGMVRRINGLTQDITEEREANQRIEQLAHFDSLTGLPNRFLFQRRASEAINLARRGNHSLALLFIDLDRFKNVNDTLGHVAGDQLLQEVSGRLRACVRGSDLVGRLGGDEFVVMLCEVSKPSNASVVANKILAAIGEPFLLGDAEVKVGCSIGIALLSDSSPDLETLMRASDTAMYAAKESGRNTFQYYNDAFYEQVQRRVQLDQELRLALPRKELFLVYQPTISMSDDKVAGIEALLRWQRTAGDLRSPAEFIPIAEESGEIIPIGRWVLREACRQAKAWDAAGMVFSRIAVNVSAVQLRDPGFATQVIAICEETGWPTERLVIELTESALMRDNESLQRAFALFESHGIMLSVDDFGTGFSNLHYLHRFPVQHLKIDRSFVSQMLDDPQVRVLTHAVISLGHALGLTVVAEGVETEAMLDTIRHQGCDEVQGYLITHPLTAPQFEHWMHQRTESSGSGARLEQGGIDAGQHMADPAAEAESH